MHWYRNAVIYEIDPMLFRDDDGDGCGDLRGITERLPYLHELGITCLWLLPIYPSPFRDGGYDVTDHFCVDVRFGTLADFDALVAAADALGIRVLIDLVVQHTSIDHRWFQQARRDQHSPCRDYYLWADHREATDVKPIFPTVEDGVWTWDDEAGQYYRHIFYKHEPDLNLGNVEVREEIKRILSFWLDHGVAGFRVDAASHMVESAKAADPRENGFWLLRELREHITGRRADAILIGEADVWPQDYVDYFGRGERLTMLYSFWLNNFLYLALARHQAEPLVRALRQQPPAPDGGRYALWVRNHDELDLERLSEDERAEVIRRFAPDADMQIYRRGIRRRLPPMLDGDTRRIAMTYALVMSLPGTPVVRYGEEIGMGDDLALEERRSVRTAMQWSDEPHAGFSCDSQREPKVPLIADGPYGFGNINVRDQQTRDDSLLAHMRRLIHARRESPAIGGGSWRTLETGCDSVFAIRHEWDGQTLFALANLAADDVAFTLTDVAEMGGAVLADSDDSDTARDGRIALRGYGYRWFRAG